MPPEGERKVRALQKNKETQDATKHANTCTRDRSARRREAEVVKY